MVIKVCVVHEFSHSNQTDVQMVLIEVIPDFTTDLAYEIVFFLIF